MSELRDKELIIKYSNRKLYSTKSSKYISLNEVYEKYNAGEPFSVIEHKTKSNITSSVIMKSMAALDDGDCEQLLNKMAA